MHPVSAFVWATDRRTLSGCPGRHAALRSVMAPWFTPQEADSRQAAVRAAAERLAAQLADRPFDALPRLRQAAGRGLSGRLARDRARRRLTFAIDGPDRRAATCSTPGRALASPEMDEHYRAVMARPDLARRRRGGAGPGRGRGARRAGGVGDPLLALGQRGGHRHGDHARGRAHRRARPVAPDGRPPQFARAAVEEAVRLGNPFPQASRFAREPFTVGDVAVRAGRPGADVADRGQPRPARAAPRSRSTGSTRGATRPAPGLGLGLPPLRAGCTTPATLAVDRGHHAGAAAARTCGMAGPWKRFVGIDDGFWTRPSSRAGRPERRRDRPDAAAVDARRITPSCAG